MKALILSAGLGTRLLPYTREIPKPLFTLENRPILAHAILRLQKVGCTRIMINTHHLHDQIENFISESDFGVDIRLLHEPDILETGGAIKNAQRFLEAGPFFVLNADVISSIDLEALYAFHLESGCTATLALHDDHRFNKVGLDAQGYITGFNKQTEALAFTGIQVLSPDIFNYFPAEDKFSSITVYGQLCSEKKIQAYTPEQIFWSDIGTPEDYQVTSLRFLCARSMGLDETQIPGIRVEPIAGDGSDRKWHRAGYENKTRIISDHGICLPGTEKRVELQSFVSIGGHLYKKGINVPQIFGQDALSGMVILEDLGNQHLLDNVAAFNKNNDPDADKKIKDLYKKVIDHMILFSQKGASGFDPDWTCQTATYSKSLILEKECRYFMDAFVNGYLKLDDEFDAYFDEFCTIADQATNGGFNGLMHRDMQSRNIMIKDEEIFFIDFQSARIGPLQYDLASLLIDPYVNLSSFLRKDLLQYTMDRLELGPDQQVEFSNCYNYCMLTRNLQFLGAFSFLSQVKKKPYFEQFIPGAARFLDKTANKIQTDRLPKLRRLFKTITGEISKWTK